MHYLRSSNVHVNLLKQVMYNSVFVKHFILSLFGDEFHWIYSQALTSLFYFLYKKKTINHVGFKLKTSWSSSNLYIWSDRLRCTRRYLISLFLILLKERSEGRVGTFIFMKTVVQDDSCNIWKNFLLCVFNKWSDNIIPFMDLCWTLRVRCNIYFDSWCFFLFSFMQKKNRLGGK